MSARTMSITLFAIAALVLAACQQSKEPAQQQAPQAQSEAPASAMTTKPAAPAPAAEPAGPAMTPKPATTSSAPKPEAPVAMTPKPAAPAPKPAATAPAPAPAPKPASTAMTAKPAAPAPAPKPAAMAATNPFNTNKCAACHAIDHDKVGPAWKTVVEKYGDAATLAKDFESGFKERRVANSIAKWKPKEGLMTGQFNNLIRGHEKEAAHALFESVKNGKFGNY